MSFKTCRHIMENGHFCNSPAVSKREYCYFHLEFRARRLKMARTRARGEQWWLDMPAIEDMRSCQAATVRVIEAIAAKLIEPDYAKLLLSSLRLAASNFKARKAWGLFSDYAIKGEFGFVGSYPNFEGVHDLPKTLDLDADPLKLFPMPDAEPASAPFIPSAGMSGSSASQNLPRTSREIGDVSLGANLGDDRASQDREAALSARLGRTLQDAATPIPGMNFQITADDMELMDVHAREGEKAAMKRAAELERQRRRRERRLQRAHYEELARNRNIQLAAQRLIMQQDRDGVKPGEFDPRAAAAEGREAQRKTAETMASSLTTAAPLDVAKKPAASAPGIQPLAPLAKTAAATPIK